MAGIPSARALAFITELTELTRKYKIVVESNEVGLCIAATDTRLVYDQVYYLNPYTHSDGSITVRIGWDTLAEARIELAKNKIPDIPNPAVKR
jgi:hypothetical protein